MEKIINIFKEWLGKLKKKEGIKRPKSLPSEQLRRQDENKSKN